MPQSYTQRYKARVPNHGLGRRAEAKRVELWKYAFQQAVVLQYHLREFYKNQYGLMLEDNYPEATRQQMISAKVHKEMSHWLSTVL